MMTALPHEWPVIRFTPREAGAAGLLVLALNLAVGALFAWLGAPGDVDFALAQAAAFQLSMALAVLLVLARRRLSLAGAFRLQAGAWPRAFGVGLAGAVAVMPVAFALAVLARALFLKLGWPVAPHPALDWLAARPGLPFRLLLYLLGAGLAPVCEELFFRGLVLQTLLGRMPALAAAVLAAALFAGLHFQPVAALPLFALAAGFTLAAFAARSLAGAIVMHAACNAFTLFWLTWLPQT